MYASRHPSKTECFWLLSLKPWMTLGNFLCHNVLQSDSDKAQKELNQNVNLKMFRITVDYLGGNLTPNIEINALLNRRPMCLFYQLMAVLMFRVQKECDHYYRSGFFVFFCFDCGFTSR